MAQVKHKQRYRSDDESYTPRSTSRSKGAINIIGIREEVANDSLLRLQKIGELLINARIRQANSWEVQSSICEDEKWLKQKAFLKVQ